MEVYIQPSSFDPAVRHRRVLVRASRPSLLVSLRPRGYLNGHQFRLHEVRHCGCGVCHPPTHPSPTHPPTHGGGFDGDDDDDDSSNDSDNSWAIEKD